MYVAKYVAKLVNVAIDVVPAVDGGLRNYNSALNRTLKKKKIEDSILISLRSLMLQLSSFL